MACGLVGLVTRIGRPVSAAVEMAEAIVSSQQAEIDTMQGMLDK